MVRTCAIFGVMGIFVAGLSVNKIEAGVVTQTQTFSDTQSNSGTGQIVHAGLSGLSASFNPFNSALGTLDSYTIVWTTTTSASGTTSSGAGGSYVLNQGGTFYVGVSAYSGGGAGNGASGGANTLLPLKTSTVNNTKTFLPSDAGVTYDPAIFGWVTGSSPFTLSYGGTSPTIFTTFTTMADVTSTLTGSVTLTYNYTASVPEPASMWIGASLLAGTVGFRRFRKKA